jgi:short-subunit dehydrogenase
MNLNGKVVVVTGAGSGMGRELTFQLVAKGAKVAAIDMRLETLLETKNLSMGVIGQVETFNVDITNADSVASLPAKISAILGEVDVLINNAGIIQPFVRINELTLDQADRVMDVNFRGTLLMVKAFLPGLLTRPIAHILNVSSMGAYAPVPGQSVYGASKAAVKLFTEGLRSELLPSHVGVTIVFPGAIATNIAANSGMSQMNADTSQQNITMTPAPIAAAAMIQAIERGKPRLVIGRDAKTLDIVSRINPVYAAKMIYKQMAELLK